MQLPSIEGIAFNLIVILPALTFHEFAHAFAADRLGDPTPRMMGRLSLNPLAHIDPIGTIIVPIFFRFGWAKPVPINPMNFSDPMRGSMITGAAGPAANLLQAFVMGMAARAMLLAHAHGDIAVGVFQLLFAMTAVNIMLAIFNLIPLGPLDGHHILEALLPYEKLMAYRRFNQYGFVILLVIIFAAPGLLQTVVFGPAIRAASYLVGQGG